MMHKPRCPVPWGLDGFWTTVEMHTSFAVWFPVSTLECTLIRHVGFQPLTTDSRSNPTPEGFEPLNKSSRSNSLTNCTLWCPSWRVNKSLQERRRISTQISRRGRRRPRRMVEWSLGKQALHWWSMHEPAIQCAPFVVMWQALRAWSAMWGDM